MKPLHFLWAAAVTLAAAVLPSAAYADRIKDLASVAAKRSNQLIGYGLVVGLQGTGDGADVSFTVQSMKSLLSRMGVKTEGALAEFEKAGAAEGKMEIKNAAAVMVTAELPGFAKPGQKIDINVSAIGKATNLRGGSLLLTSLRGIDGEVYALAQGALTATGIDAAAAGTKVAIGVPLQRVFRVGPRSSALWTPPLPRPSSWCSISARVTSPPCQLSSARSTAALAMAWRRPSTAFRWPFGRRKT